MPEMMHRWASRGPARTSAPAKFVRGWAQDERPLPSLDTLYLPPPYSPYAPPSTCYL